ncbi:MAG: cytidine deaminase, partial [Clostridia bacterium]|nr:cytidine deaminase [Clostridia bacterium]
LNAILNATVPLKNAILYVTLFPCQECAKAIIQSGIKKVVVKTTKTTVSSEYKAAKRMFDSAGVQIEQY